MVLLAPANMIQADKLTKIEKDLEEAMQALSSVALQHRRASVGLRASTYVQFHRCS